MSTPRSQRSDPLDNPPGSPYYDARPSTPSYGAATYATFSPTTLGSTTPSGTSAAKRRSTILVHQKSPLLLATPPQVTRALAYSHPFLLPLNTVAGLLSWTTRDTWESFLLVTVFWAVVLYGDVVILVAGPILFAVILIAGMYGRRFSPLSSSGRSDSWEGSSTNRIGDNKKKTKNLAVADALPDNKLAHGSGSSYGAKGGGHSRNQSGAMSGETTSTRHQKTLDEMVETLKEFTGRCNLLLEPLLELTDFLSTQRTATSATTRPSLTTLFVRILICTPFWFALTLPPWHIVTARRVVLVCGTLALTWHARSARVARAVLWRSATIRRLLALVTGLRFEGPTRPTAKRPLAIAADVKAKSSLQEESEMTKAVRRGRVAGQARRRDGSGSGVRFTFIIFENQRRWVGLGWTNNLFAYERAAWTDEQNNAVPPRSKFELPDVEDGSRTRWRWAEGSRWRVDGVPDDAVAGVEKEGEDGAKEWDYDGTGGKVGWVFYDNKWQNGRRGQDGWGRWTRRRKWFRDAELVEIDYDEDSDGALSQDLHSKDGGALSKEITPTPNLPPRPSQQVHSLSTMPPPPYDAVVMDHEKEMDTDTASTLSSTTSSTGRSFSNRWKSSRAPSTRHRGAESFRRDEANEEAEEADALGTSLGLAPQDAGRDGEGWGVGDEVRMGLE